MRVVHAAAPTSAPLRLGRLSCALLLLLASCTPSAPPPRPAYPNVILFIADDHGWPYYGFAGSDVVQTPNLDALVRSGTLFPNAYNTASTCLPSLRSILTGLYPHQFEWLSAMYARESRLRKGTRGHVLDRLPKLPNALRDAGYATFQAGKLWDGTFQEAGFTDGMTGSKEAAATYLSSNEAAHALGRETLEPVFSFIRRQGAEPFFVWFAVQLPHVPFDAPEAYRAPYVGRRLNRTERAYFANCTWEDAVMGRVLDFLDREGLRERTLVVYLSDNGWEPPRGDGAGRFGGQGGKGSMREIGSRTPLIFSWPGHVPAGRVVDDFVSTVDIFPTLVTLAGGAPPRDLPGLDLSATVLGGSQPGRTFVVGGQFQRGGPRKRPPFQTYVGDAYHVTDADWHYILWGGDLNREMLFDKHTDPREQNDLADRHPERIAEYRERVLSWLDEIGLGRERLGWMPAAMRNRKR